MTKEGYIRRQKVLQNRLMKKHLPRVYAALQKQINITIRNILAAESVSADPIQKALDELSRNHFVNPWIGPVVQALYKDAGNQAAARYRVEKALVIPLTGFVRDVIDYFNAFLLEKVVLPISQTTVNQVKTVLKQAISDGWGVDKTVRELKNSSLTKYRAKMIVRTESVRAMNYAQLKAADNDKFQVEKKWLAVEDRRTRFTHGHNGVDGEIRDLHDSFANGLLFPGDPNGSAAETINCFLPNQLTYTDLRNIKKAFRCWYDGKIVTIKMTNGNCFTCTVNHPILTGSGWVAAGKLNSGDNLIKSSFIRNITPAEFKINSMPTSFEQAYNSFVKTGFRMRVRNSIVNFYGDIPTGDIDIVCSKSKLLNYSISGVYDRIRNFIFKYSDLGSCRLFGNSPLAMAFYKKICWQISHSLVSMRGQFLPFFEWCLFHSQIHRIASPARLYSSPFEPTLNDISGNAEFDREPFNAHTLFKKPDNLISRDNSPEWLLNNSFNGFNNSLDSVIITAENISHFLNGDAFFSKTENVLSVELHEYSGYVYTLETDTQMYDINGLVARNCRCTLSYNIKRDLAGNPLRKVQPARIAV